MRASQIKIFYPELNVSGISDADITGIELNSKKIKPGNIFVAIKGKRFDSHSKIDEAFRNGAVGAVLEKNLEIPEGKLKILTDDSRKTYAMLSALFFDFPSTKLKVIGITGTSGKTTTAFLLYKFFNSIGIKSGFIGTVGIGTAEKFHRTETFPPTTPDAFTLNEILANMLKNSIKYIFMEVSAQAITFKRIATIKFYRKILTTIGHEHLDFYGIFEDYLNTKISFFEKCEKPILNADSPYVEKFKNVSHGYTLFGIENPADVEGSIKQQGLENISFVIKYKGIEDLITLNMSGAYNVSNFLAASAFILEEGYKINDIKRFAIHIPMIPGRGNLLQKNGKSVFIDFAHNPLEIENVLKHLREFTNGSLITVFGVVGFSTYKKRVEMGEIASKYSDFVVITTDDPRGDDPQKIAEDVLMGAKSNGKIVLDRKEAIREGISMLKEGDMAAILGRGDETVMYYKDKKIYLKDLDTVKEALDGS